MYATLPWYVEIRVRVSPPPTPTPNPTPTRTPTPSPTPTPTPEQVLRRVSDALGGSERDLGSALGS